MGHEQKRLDIVRLSYYIGTREVELSPRKSRHNKKEEITESMEDYLEAILEIEAETGCPEVRVSDIARKLKVTRPSVVGMIKHLVEHELVDHDHYGAVTKTERGRKIAQEVMKRHMVLRRFLEEVLGLDAEVAEEDACKMEHTLSDKAIERFIALEEFRSMGPDDGRLKGESFRKYLKERKS